MEREKKGDRGREGEREGEGRESIKRRGKQEKGDEGGREGWWPLEAQSGQCYSKPLVV